MGIHKSSVGVIKVGSDTVAEIKSYNLEESAETIETTNLGASAKTFTSGTTSFSGSMDAYWDETDTAQLAMTAGAEITISIYPEGTATGAKYKTGSVVIDSITIEGSQDDMVATSFSFTGDGVLSDSTA